jgi:hypothetical protein
MNSIPPNVWFAQNSRNRLPLHSSHVRTPYFSFRKKLEDVVRKTLFATKARVSMNFNEETQN